MQKTQQRVCVGSYRVWTGLAGVLIVVVAGGFFAGCATTGDLEALTARIERQVQGFDSAANNGDAQEEGEAAGEHLVAPAHPVSLLAPSRFVSWAVDRDGALWRWGANDQDLGIIPDAKITDETSPHRVFEGVRWREIAAGPRFFAGITEDGTLHTWGVNDRGVLGIADRYTSAWIAGLQSPAPDLRWRSVAAGSESIYAVSEDGALYAWGNHEDGRLGIGPVEESNLAVVPVETWQDEGFVTVLAVPAPARVGSRSDWRSVIAGPDFALAITESDELYAWGDNSYGQLGLGDRDIRLEPVRVGAYSDWEVISAGGRHVLGIRTGGELYAWGDNGMGQLGLGHLDPVSEPVRVGTRNDWMAAAAYEGFRDARMGLHSPASAAITVDGRLFTWGSNEAGQLGDLDSVSPELVPFRSEPAVVETAGSGFIDVAAGGAHALAIRRNGDVYGWGYNERRQAGPFPWTGTDSVSLSRLTLE